MKSYCVKQKKVTDCVSGSGRHSWIIKYEKDNQISMCLCECEYPIFYYPPKKAGLKCVFCKLLEKEKVVKNFDEKI